LNNSQAEWSDRYRFFHTGRWPVGAEPNDYKYKNFAIRNEQFRMVGLDELYDIQKDPGQTTNVIELYPENARMMLEAYELWWEETRPLMINEGVPLSPVHPFHEKFYEQEKNGGIPDWIRTEF
jgi:hypothetical protein